MSSYKMGAIYYWQTDKYQSEVLISLFIVRLCTHTIYNHVNHQKIRDILFVDTNNMEDNDTAFNIELCILYRRYDNDEIYILCVIIHGIGIIQIIFRLAQCSIDNYLYMVLVHVCMLIYTIAHACHYIIVIVLAQQYYSIKGIQQCNQMQIDNYSTIIR